MRRSRKCLFSMVVLVTGGLRIGMPERVLAQSQPPPATDRYVKVLGPFLEKALRDDKLPGLAVGVVENGRQVYSHGIGSMKLGDPNRPVTTQTLFHMASVTKPFVATAVMQLAEKGKVSLDAPVVKYLPYFRLKDARYKSITVRQMLTHTSGMPDVEDYGWDKPEYDDGSLERYVRGLSEQSLKFAPGSAFAYSNMAYEVLGDLIAKVSETKFEDYVAANILQPLRMRSSTLLIKQADPAKLATGYTRPTRDADPIAITHYPYNRAHSPSSNLHSNVEDMVRWIMVNLNHGELDGRRILTKSSHDLMWTPAFEQAGKVGKIGISWFITEEQGQRLIMHSGGDDGFTTHVAFVPARKLGIVLLFNADRGAFKRIWDRTLSIALGQ